MTEQTKAPDKKPIRDAASYVVTDMRDELMWMADDAELAGLMRGEKKAIAERKWKRAQPGETVKGLPAMSVASLLAKRWIVKPGEPWQVNPAKAPAGGDA